MASSLRSARWQLRAPGVLRSAGWRGPSVAVRSLANASMGKAARPTAGAKRSGKSLQLVSMAGAIFPGGATVLAMTLAAVDQDWAKPSAGLANQPTRAACRRSDGCLVVKNHAGLLGVRSTCGLVLSWSRSSCVSLSKLSLLWGFLRKATRNGPQQPCTQTLGPAWLLIQVWLGLVAGTNLACLGCLREIEHETGVPFPRGRFNHAKLNAMQFGIHAARQSIACPESWPSAPKAPSRLRTTTSVMARPDNDRHQAQPFLAKMRSVYGDTLTSCGGRTKSPS